VEAGWRNNTPPACLPTTHILTIKRPFQISERGAALIPQAALSTLSYQTGIRPNAGIAMNHSIRNGNCSIRDPVQPSGFARDAGLPIHNILPH